MIYLDYSSYKSWMRCPWAWYETYVNKRSKRWPDSQRDDALAIGQLVHAGLENWQKYGHPDIPSDVVHKVGPTSETLTLCEGLVIGYASHYPSEQWPLILTEQPLQFPINPPNVTGVAKVDAYFYVPELTTLDSGDGQAISLSPGWWVHEYKTKDISIDRAKYMQGWENNLQASFQMIALRHHLRNWASNMSDDELCSLDVMSYETMAIQGVLVNVIEKPRVYIPRRKCRRCDMYWDFSAWLPTGDGKHCCPMCGTAYKLQPVSSTDAERNQPNYYRLIVQRTPERLERDFSQIQQVAQAMEAMKMSGMDTYPPNRESCFDTRRGECGYYKPHLANYSTLDSEEYVEAEDYLGLTQIETQI